MAAQPINSVLHQPPPSDAERRRIRDLYRYYCAYRQPPISSDDPLIPIENDDRPDGPALSKDTVLTALVQLGVYRFGCNRAFVSLIDGQNQHILSEATASISLRNRDIHLPGDGLYLGVTTLDLVFGVCPHAMNLFAGKDVPELPNTSNMTANLTRFIVRDFTKEETFKDRPYVTGWPHFRFYAEVPIYSPAGYVLGSFCVVDDKPRHDFVDDEVTALQEISDSIAQHLENVRIVQSHSRSDRLVHGLTNFVKGRPEDARSSKSSSPAGVGRLDDLPHLSEQSSSEESRASTPNMEALSLTSTATDDNSPSRSAQDFSIVTRSTSLTSPPQESTTPQSSIDGVAKEKPEQTLAGERRRSAETTRPGTPLITVKEGVPISRRVDALFSHAGFLLRDSMDLDGVLFVDATHCNFGIGPSVELTDWEPFPTAANTDFETRPSNSPPTTNTNTLCKVLGSTCTEPSHETVLNGIPPGSVSEVFLQHLVSIYPEGEIFDLDGVVPAKKDSRRTLRGRKSRNRPFENGRQSPNALQVTTSRLASYFPDAKTVVFLPLWDWNKGHWLAGTFIWIRDNERPLELEEFHYFKVFGDAIISEIAKAKSFDLENSKSDFISSVSHELRSPLHGMLASAEILLETVLQPEQRDLVKMLETCGLTLLDTMNHLLDFTKINNLTSIEDSKNPFHDPSTTLANVFDLDVLLEEVVCALYAGKLHVSRYTGTSADNERENIKRDLENMSVVLRVTDQNNWKMRSISGAWRRIIMGIFGNALKYTQAGFVEVSLSKFRKKSKSAAPVFAHLCITDTGCGMSADFLENKLFSPFAQEDALSEGVGLGMSIVQQLVGLMKGTIDVKSEPTTGTQVDIYIPISSFLQSPALTRTPSSCKTQFCLIGFDGYSDLTEVPTGSLSREAKRRLCIQSFLTQIITQHPDWNVTFAGTPGSAVGDVAIIEEAILDKIAADESLQSSNLIAFARLLVLRNGVPSSGIVKLGNITAGVVHTIYPPFCPRKMLNALKWTLNTKSPPTVPKKSNLRIEGMPSTTSEMNHLVAADIAKVSSINRPLVPTLDVVTPVIERQSFLDNDQSLHVLIVDDNDINLKVLSTFVGKLGHTYETASNGLIALNKYKESTRRFNLVLMDISMPVMDGLVATSHIRGFEKQQLLDPVTILAVTGVASATMQQQALAAGIDSYLIKPLSLQQLKRAIAKNTKKT